jgi:hypothetical protein
VKTKQKYAAVIKQEPVKPERRMLTKELNLTGCETLKDIVDFFEGEDFSKVQSYSGYEGIEAFAVQYPESDEAYQKSLDAYAKELAKYEAWKNSSGEVLKLLRAKELQEEIDKLKAAQKMSDKKMRDLLKAQKENA